MEKVVCVTGASGYIASWIVKLLLECGYTVKASVRDPGDPSKTKHLCELPGASERLHLFKANLLDEGAFDSIVDGCIGVFHTASPCILLDVKDPQAELIDPAVKGTLNVLSSCAKTPSIKRVVVTSSIAAVAHNRTPQTPDTIIDESSFSDPDYCEELKFWYVLSKTLAEESAWKFAKDHNIDMVTINPGVVIGPLLQPTLNSTVGMILYLVNGATIYPNLTTGWVDVRDVMKAHILAFETPSASGRYCLVEKTADFAEIITILRQLYPDLHLAEKCADVESLPPVYNFCKKKATTLGLTFTPFEVSLKETIESLKDKKFISF